MGILYSVTIPLWEANDEPAHFAYAQYIAVNRSLPQPGDPTAQALLQKHQPPLYYVITAAALSRLEQIGDTSIERNPYFHHGNAGANYAVHGHDENFPYRGTALAVHVARWVSVAIGTFAVLLTFLAARMLWPERPVLFLGATALHAFWPQFLVVGSVVTNDVLIITLSSLVLYICLRLVLRGFDPPWVILLWLAISVGLLSKLNALALFPLAGFCSAISLWRRARNLTLGQWVYAAASIAVAVSAVGVTWMYLQSLEFLSVPGLDPLRALQAPRTLADLAQERLRDDIGQLIVSSLGYSFRTYFATFGWQNVPTPGWLYTTWAGAALGAAIGMASWLSRRATQGQRVAWVVLLSHAVSFGFLALGLAILVGSPDFMPGRFVLPNLTSVSLLLLLGWRSLVPNRYEGRVLAALGVGLAAVAIAIPFATIMPAYAKPSPLRPQDMELLEYRLGARFGESIELVAYDIDREYSAPGQEIQLTLYWRALASISENYIIRVGIVGYDGQGYGHLYSYPGRGNYATSLWQPGSVFPDPYRIAIRPDFPASGLASVEVAIHEVTYYPGLPVVDGQNQPIGNILTFGAIPVRQLAPIALSGMVDANYRLGVDGNQPDRAAIALLGHRLEQQPARLKITLLWKALAAIERDYSVFVHIRDANGRVWAQHDGFPRKGGYPTSYWIAGETVADEHLIPLQGRTPEAPHEVYVGMYDPQTLQRLAVWDSSGERIVTDEIPLDIMDE